MRAFWIIAIGFGFAGCASGVTRDHFSEQLRLWPEEPAIARIALIGEFTSAIDLGIKGSAWSRFVSVTAGRDDGVMLRPMDVAVVGGGERIYVADPEAGCVHRFDTGDNRYRCLAPKLKDGIAAPIGLAITEDGHLFVTDSVRGGLWHARPSGKYLEPFDVSETLEQPTGIYWDNVSQHLYVTDTKQHTVLKFDRIGDLEHTIGEVGNGPGQFNHPTYVWVDSNQELLVTDSLNFRLQRLRNDGGHLLTFGVGGDRPGDFSRPKGVATDSSGHVYVVDGLMHTLQIFDRQGRLLLAVGEHGQGRGLLVHA